VKIGDQVAFDFWFSNVVFVGEGIVVAVPPNASLYGDYLIKCAHTGNLFVVSYHKLRARFNQVPAE